MSDPRQITVSGELFTVQPPFAAGHTLSEGEAHALNQTWCEAIRNNTAKAVKTALEAGDKSAAEKAVADYATSYEFSIRTPAESSAKLDPLEREARKIAKELVHNKIAALGKKVSDYDKEGLLAKIISVSETNADVREEAAKRVKAQSKFVEKAGLADLEL